MELETFTPQFSYQLKEMPIEYGIRELGIKENSLWNVRPIVAEIHLSHKELHKSSINALFHTTHFLQAHTDMKMSDPIMYSEYYFAMKELEELEGNENVSYWNDTMASKLFGNFEELEFGKGFFLYDPIHQILDVDFTEQSVYPDDKEKYVLSSSINDAEFETLDNIYTDLEYLFQKENISTMKHWQEDGPEAMLEHCLPHYLKQYELILKLVSILSQRSIAQGNPDYYVYVAGMEEMNRLHLIKKYKDEGFKLKFLKNFFEEAKRLREEVFEKQK